METPANIRPTVVGALHRDFLAKALTDYIDGGTTVCSPHLKTRTQRRSKEACPCPQSLLSSGHHHNASASYGSVCCRREGELQQDCNRTSGRLVQGRVMGAAATSDLYQREALHSCLPPANDTHFWHAFRWWHSKKHREGKQRWAPDSNSGLNYLLSFQEVRSLVLTSIR